MTTNNAAAAAHNAPLDPVLTAFLVEAGIDLVLSAEGRRIASTRISYGAMSGLLDGRPVAVELPDDDALLAVTLGDLELELVRQPKGHYFAPVRPRAPKSPVVDIAFARKAVATAAKARARRA